MVKIVEIISMNPMKTMLTSKHAWSCAALFVSCIMGIILLYLLVVAQRRAVRADIRLNQPIFRIFDINLEDEAWDEHLDNVQKARGKWVLLSPMQMHNNIRNQWWSRYQPISYLYSENTLALLSALCAKAASRNLNIMMDVVWNHTSILKYSAKTKHRYNEKKTREPGATYSADEETTMWFSDGLPDLNTRLDEVKQEALTAVMQCRAAGVTGFRIDAFAMIDDAFFDHVFKGTPSHELHLYELPDASRYINRMFHRIRADGCEVVFYNTATHGKISDVANQVLKTDTTENILQLFPPSEHLMNASLSHDTIMSFNNNEPLYLFMYFLISKFIQSDKYFVYDIMHFQKTSVTIHQLLFNWDNYFHSVEPIMQIIQREAPNVIGTLSVYQSDNRSPMIIGSLGRNLKMLINLKRANNDVTTDEIPAQLLFGGAKPPGHVVALLKNGKRVQLKNGMVYVPDNSYTIVKNESGNEAPKPPMRLLFFWYQGWDAAPQYAKDAVAAWTTYENCSAVCLDRQTIAPHLNGDDMQTIAHIERCIPAPYVYAVVCDYVRWAVLARAPGAYVDCDVFPTSTTRYLLNCYHEYDRIVLGKESGETAYVNNAFIIVPPSCQPFVTPIVAAMRENVLALTPQQFGAYNQVHRAYNQVHSAYNQVHRAYNGGAYNQVHRAYNGGAYNQVHRAYNGGAYNGGAYGKYKNDAIFEWVIQNTGPGFLERMTSAPGKANQYMILDCMWLYPNYQLDNKKERSFDMCGENIGLIQHCYVGDWVPY